MGACACIEAGWSVFAQSAAQIALLYPIVIGDGSEAEQRQNVGWTMVAFGVVVFVSFFYIYKFVPETHQKTLEEIERAFAFHNAGPEEGDGEGSDVPMQTIVHRKKGVAEDQGDRV